MKDHICAYDNYELGSGVGCKICDSRRAAPEEPAQEEPKKMNWPIAIYSQNGELPIKFGIENTICGNNFSLRLINEFADGWKVILWYNAAELRVFRVETLVEAEARAQELLLDLATGFVTTCKELGVALDLGA